MSCPSCPNLTHPPRPSTGSLPLQQIFLNYFRLKEFLLLLGTDGTLCLFLHWDALSDIASYNHVWPPLVSSPGLRAPEDRSHACTRHLAPVPQSSAMSFSGLVTWKNEPSSVKSHLTSVNPFSWAPWPPLLSSSGWIS